jgi:hypothetical protein
MGGMERNLCIESRRAEAFLAGEGAVRPKVSKG